MTAAEPDAVRAALTSAVDGAARDLERLEADILDAIAEGGGPELVRAVQRLDGVRQDLVDAARMIALTLDDRDAPATLDSLAGACIQKRSRARVLSGPVTDGPGDRAAALGEMDIWWGGERAADD